MEDLSKAIDGLISMAKRSNAALCEIKSVRKSDGYTVKLVCHKDGVTPYDEFSHDQVVFIRDIMGEQIQNSQKAWEKAVEKGEKYPIQEEELEIINVCQEILNCPRFESVSQFYNNESNSWNEIIEK